MSFRVSPRLRGALEAAGFPVADVEVPFLTPTSPPAALAAIRANECYETAVAAFAGERGFVRAAFLKSQHVALVKLSGKRPVLIFFDLEKEVVKKKIASKVSVIDTRFKDEVKEDVELQFDDLKIMRLTMLADKMAKVFSQHKLGIVSQSSHKNLMIVDVECVDCPKIEDVLVYPVESILSEKDAAFQCTVKCAKETSLDDIFKTAVALATNFNLRAYVSGYSIRVKTDIHLTAEILNQIMVFNPCIVDVIPDVRPSMLSQPKKQSTPPRDNLLILMPIAAKIITPSVVRAVCSVFKKLEGLKGEMSGYLFKVTEGSPSEYTHLTLNGAFRFINYSRREDF